MAVGFSRIYNGLNLVPQTTTAVSVAGDLRYNTSTNKTEIYNGAVDSVVTETLAATLANKTLTSPVINTPTADTITGIAGGTLTVQSASGQTLQVSAQGSAALNLSTNGVNRLTISGAGVMNIPGSLSITGTISASNFTGTSTGTNTGDQTITLTGDVTGSGTGSFATTLAATTNATLTTLSGLTSAASLATVGTVTTGTWNATTIALNHGGTGQTTKAAAFDALQPMTTGGDIIYGGASGTGTRLANGSSGQVLTSNGGTSAPSWQTSSGGTTTTNPYELINLGLSVTAATSNLTVALKQSDGSTDPASGTGAVKASFRSNTATSGLYNERSITAALSFVVASTVRLGMMSSQNNYLWLYLIDSDGAGTMKLAVSTLKQDEGTLQNVIASSFTGTVTIASPAVWTATGHGLLNGDAVTFSTTGALPTGISANTIYWIINKAANTFQISLVPGGTAVNTTGTQSGTHSILVCNTRMVSDNVYTGVPIRLIGRSQFNLVTPGTWIAPTEVSISPLGFAPENISAIYSAANTITLANNTDTVMDAATKVVDTHGLVLTGTGNWRFVCPKAGQYQIEMAITTGSIAPGNINQNITANVYKNGTLYKRISQVEARTTSTINPYVQGSTTGDFALNDNIYVDIIQNMGGSINSNANGTNDWVAITIAN